MSRIMLLVCEAHQNIYTLLQLLLLFGELHLCCCCAFARRDIDAVPPHSGPPAMVPAMGCAALPPLMPCGRGADAECVVYRPVVGCAIAAP